MKTNAGLWIDHRRAIIVALSAAGETTTRVLSGVEKQLRRSSAPSEGKFKAHQAPADDSRENAFTGHLARYYDEIISSLHDAVSILIIGPGEAKEELKKRFNAREGEPRVIALEPAAQMTEPQVEALVRRYFRTRRSEKR